MNGPDREKELTMTSFKENRTQPRINCRIPTEYTLKRSRKAHPATVYNISDIGLYIETGRELRPGQDIRIHMGRTAAIDLLSASPGDHTGIIRWAFPMSRGRHQIYGAGVMLMYPGAGIQARSFPDVQYFCDMCGEQIGFSRIRKEGLVWLCPHCSEYVHHLPAGISRVTSRHLIGNVL
jgi:predicted RNA-binding Zn-ribbon protein involved in translation (DUF1610 family)